MKNPLLIEHIIAYIDNKYCDFFNSAQKSTIDYININEDGIITFKQGIVLDDDIYNDMKTHLKINPIL